MTHSSRRGLSMHRILLAGLVITFAAGCGGNSTASPSPSGSTLALTPATAPADGTASVTATATIRDGGGGPLGGVPVVFSATGAGNAWNPATATTDASGVATAALTSTVAGARTVSVTASGVAIAQAPTATFVARPRPSGSDLTVNPPTAIADGASQVSVSAVVRDWSGAPIAGVPVTFAATGTGHTWNPTTAPTDASGVATSTLVSTITGARSVTATADGVAIAQSRTVTFVASPSPSRSDLTVAPALAWADGTSSVTATATVRDGSGAPVPGIEVVFVASGSGHAWAPPATPTDANGVASSAITSLLGERKTIRVVAGGVAIERTQDVEFVAVPDRARSSVVVSRATATADGRSPVTVVATVRDPRGGLLAGVPVTFAASGSGQVFTPASATTDVHGVAASSLTSTVAGTTNVRADANGALIAESPAVIFTPPPPVSSDLVISELGSWFVASVPAWLEIHNGTGAEVKLSGYALRAPAIDADTSACTVGASTFPLPDLDLPPGGYAVVAGRVGVSNVDGGLLVHVSDESERAPCWRGSGFAELQKGGVTVDFVRFGDSTVVPTTPTWSWVGVNAVAFPAETLFNVALARRPPSAATRSAADWEQVTFATPGGPNDVARGATDSDGDGVPDSAKVAGGTFAGLDLFAMGARPGQRDVFIELDAMQSSDPGIVPRKEAIDAVVKRFLAHGIHLHVDAGARFAPAFAPEGYNLGQTTHELAYSICVTFPQQNASCPATIYGYKAQNMEVSRRAIFHYALFGSSANTDGRRGESGRADVVGSNLLVTLGRWNLSVADQASLNTTVNQQASTFMHEFGHNLGLRHGGNEDQNYKPNYLSVMNYLHQLTGLPDPAADTAGDRYRYQRFPQPNQTLCALDRSPCVAPDEFRLDYSDGSSEDLDQAKVSEKAGLGRKGHWVDFDGSGFENDGYALVLNPRGGTALGKLSDFDDWRNLKLPFQSGASWLYGGALRRSARIPPRPIAPFDDHAREISTETAPPESFFESLRSPGGAP